MTNILSFLKKTLKPRGLRSFLYTIENKNCKILDVGCGNQSSFFLKTLKPDSTLYGIDVSDFNQSEESKGQFDRYIIERPEMFDRSIQNIEEDFEIIISNHNIEHCNDPEKTFRAMVDRTAVGGHIFIATPSICSINFPSRGGGLNFYDDPTHQKYPVDLMKLFKSESKRLECIFYSESSKPFIWYCFGGMLEFISRKLDRILLGTYEYYGFEQVMWLKKID